MRLRFKRLRGARARPAQPPKQRVRWRGLRWTGLSLLMLSSGLGAHMAFQYLLDPGDFPIRQVRLEGKLHHLNSADVEEVLQQYLGESFFALNIDALHAILATNPWVAQATVWRQWPDTLKVHLQERVVYGRWGEDELIDSNGERFRPTRLGQFSHLPQLSGPDGYEMAIMQTYEQANVLLKRIGLELTALVLDERYAWQMTLRNGIALELGREHLRERLTRFLDVYPKVLAGRIHGIERIDLRYINGFAVRWKSQVKVTRSLRRNNTNQREALQRTHIGGSGKTESFDGDTSSVPDVVDEALGAQHMATELTG